ncbi:MAG: peptidoglycan-binding protein [Rhodothermaceae bacterium]|nr:peptidoglycan-binding protein [Rhodothermaceae bacterium]
MTCRLLLGSALLTLATTACAVQGWESAIVSTDPDGRLQYATDAEGNRVPDFSRAGYRGGGVDLPVVPTVRTLAPVEGDDTASIQAALDAVMALPVGPDGRRGALELTAGSFEVGGTLVIRASGVVLRGAGDGDDPTASTVLRRSGANPEPVVYVGQREHGSGDALIRRAQGHASALIEDDVVPVGAWSFRVDHPEGLRPGAPVVVYHPATAGWLEAVDHGATASEPGWAVGQHPIAFARTVTDVTGSMVTLDAPTFYRLDRSLSPSYVYWRDDRFLIREVGVEDLRIEIETTSETDETQAENAVVLALVEDGWVQRVTARHFWRAGVRVENSRYVTVRDSRALAPHSVVDGGRRYNFMVEKSQLVLFQGNVASHGRHAYVGNGETLDSGIVFLDNVSEDAFTSSEAHRQWSMGFLYDHHTEVGSVGRETHDRRIHLGNRGDYGTQHGWACANCVVWNAQMNGALVIVEKPPTAQNYAIGVQGAVSNRGPFLTTAPHVEGTNRADLSPRSLYLRQLADRLRPVER